MSSSKKKRVVEDRAAEEDVSDESDEEGMEEESGEESDEEMPNQEVQVEFEARNPEGHDYHSIRKLLQQLFLKAYVNLSELTDTIISQNYIGSVIRQVDVSEDDDSDEMMDVEDIFGIMTVINITERQNLDSVKQIKTLLCERCKECSPGDQDTLRDILHSADHQVGLLINERFLNIPPQIALPSFESLWQEVDRAKKKKMKYDFDYFVMIGKTYRLAGGGGGDGKQSGSKMVLQDTFANAEEEFFAQESALRFEYSVASEHDVTVGGEWGDEEQDLEPTRTVMVIPAAKLPAIMTQLRDVLSLPS